MPRLSRARAYSLYGIHSAPASMYSRALVRTSYYIIYSFFIIYSASNSVYSATLREDKYSGVKSEKRTFQAVFLVVSEIITIFAAFIIWKDYSRYVVNMFAMDAYLLGKRLSDALSLAVLNLANSIQCQRTKQRWMLIGVYIFCPRPTLTGYWGII